jgi:hypothetical protein
LQTDVMTAMEAKASAKQFAESNSNFKETIQQRKKAQDSRMNYYMVAFLEQRFSTIDQSDVHDRTKLRLMQEKRTPEVPGLWRHPMTMALFGAKLASVHKQYQCDLWSAVEMSRDLAQVVQDLHGGARPALSPSRVSSKDTFLGKASKTAEAAAQLILAAQLATKRMQKNAYGAEQSQGEGGDNKSRIKTPWDICQPYVEYIIESVRNLKSHGAVVVPVTDGTYSNAPSDAMFFVVTKDTDTYTLAVINCKKCVPSDLYSAWAWVDCSVLSPWCSPFAPAQVPQVPPTDRHRTANPLQVRARVERDFDGAYDKQSLVVGSDSH